MLLEEKSQVRGRAAYSQLSLVSLLIGALVALQLLNHSVVMIAEATQHNVGDDAGWGLDVNYTAWAENYTYATGDTLCKLEHFVNIVVVCLVGALMICLIT